MRALAVLWGIAACAGGTPIEVDASGADARTATARPDARPDDTGTLTTIPIDVDGDCVEIVCPDLVPYPARCDVSFEGNDPRGCVAWVQGGQGLYFQEGDDCGAGHLSGSITCADRQGPPLSPDLCPIDKPEPHYVPTPEQCPAID